MMDHKQLIKKLKDIKTIDNQLLRTIYNSFIDINKYVKNIISPELYEKIQIELHCVYYESIYGNNDKYSWMVYIDFIEALDDIITMVVSLL